MSYKQIKQYGYRDNLESGDPEKVIYGADFDGEFNAIEVAMEKIVGGDMDVDIEDVEGLQAALDDKADKTDLDGFQSDLDGKADLDHTHEIADVDGLQDALDDLVTGDVVIPDDLEVVTLTATSNVKSKTYSETTAAVGYSGGNATADLTSANNFSMDFSGNTSYPFALTGAPSGAGDAYGCTLTLDTTNMAALTWGANVQWSGGVAPTLVADTVNVITFITTDGGTSFKGFVGGQAFA